MSSGNGGIPPQRCSPNGVYQPGQGQRATASNTPAGPSQQSGLGHTGTGYTPQYSHGTYQQYAHPPIGYTTYPHLPPQAFTTAPSITGTNPGQHTYNGAGYDASTLGFQTLSQYPANYNQRQNEHNDYNKERKMKTPIKPSPPTEHTPQEAAAPSTDPYSIRQVAFKQTKSSEHDKSPYEPTSYGSFGSTQSRSAGKYTDASKPEAVATGSIATSIGQEYSVSSEADIVGHIHRNDETGKYHITCVKGCSSTSKRVEEFNRHYEGFHTGVTLQCDMNDCKDTFPGNRYDKLREHKLNAHRPKSESR